jgi:hypothetical protein
MVAEVSIKERMLKEDATRTNLEPWSLKRSAILAKYTTCEKLSLTTSFLLPMNKDKSSFYFFSWEKKGSKIYLFPLKFFLKVIAKAPSTTITTTTTTTISVSDKIKSRLEQLDQFDDDNMQQMINLSQQEYMKSIEELNNALFQAWKGDERVKALKIVIQVN